MVTLNDYASPPKIFDPNYDEKAKSERRARGIGDLVRKAGLRRQSIKRVSGKGSGPSQQLSDVQLGTLCKNKIGDESCWSVVADHSWQDSLQNRVEDLLDAQHHKLYERDRREFVSSMELFLVGKTLKDARLAMIVSCYSESDHDRLQKLLKKFRTVPGEDHISVMAMFGGPRSVAPLVPLLSPSGSRENDPVIDERLLEGTTVYGVLGPQNTLTIPAEIWIGRTAEDAHKVVLGGLISTGFPGTKMGLTVAHLSPSNSTNTVVTDARTKSAIGIILSTSNYQTDLYLDWAMVKFDSGIRLRTTFKPPRTISSQLESTINVKLLTTRGPVKGVLSPSVTYIRIGSRQTTSGTHAIILDEPLRAGDSGVWVVGSDGNLYGHVAFGHVGDKVAYIISARDIVDDIAKENPIYANQISLTRLKESSQRKILKDENLTQDQVSKQSPEISSKAQADATAAQVEKSQTNSRLGLHRKWREKLRRDNRKTNLRFAGTCMAYMLFLTMTMSAYFVLSTWALASKSKLAARGRRRQAALMFQLVDELQMQVEKHLARFHPDALKKQDEEEQTSFIKRTLANRQTTLCETKLPQEKSTLEARDPKIKLASKSKKTSSPGGPNDVVTSNRASQDHPSFWSRLRRKLPGVKAHDLATKTVAQSKTEDSGTAMDQQRTQQLYEYSGGEETDVDVRTSDGSNEYDSDDNGEDDDLIGVGQAIFRKVEGRLRKKRRSRSRRSDESHYATRDRGAASRPRGRDRSLSTISRSRLGNRERSRSRTRSRSVKPITRRVRRRRDSSYDDDYRERDRGSYYGRDPRDATATRRDDTGKLVYPVPPQPSEAVTYPTEVHEVDVGSGPNVQSLPSSPADTSKSISRASIDRIESPL